MITHQAVRPPAPILPDTVLPYLRSRGLQPGDGASVTALTDGVSARVYLVEGVASRWVVKQALPELDVEVEWLANPQRATTEANALRLVGKLTPGNLPTVIDADPVDFALTMSAAPAGMVNWRRLLLEEMPTSDQLLFVGRELGTLLGTWHRETWDDKRVADQFDDDETFEQLRVTPFHRAVLGKFPEAAVAIEACITDLEIRRECLVHGDFSPKNILVSSSKVWVLDFEVARVGAAVFDLAFLGHHLALKAMVSPHRAIDLRTTFAAFLSAYSTSRNRPVDNAILGWHIGALMLARVDGVSPAGYLTESQRGRVRAAALEILRSDNSSADAAWNAVLAMSARRPL